MSLKSQTIQQITRRVFFGAGEPIDWPLPNEMMGIELEAESVYIGTQAPLNLAGWTIDRDGSLRNDGREFVLSQPLAGSSLTRAIHTLFAMQSPVNGQILRYQANPRAGTHIHINWIQDTVGSAAALIALMYMIEPLVYSWADEDRAWCSYCNPLSDIPANILNKLLRMDNEDEDDGWLIREIDDESVGRYHGLNIVALAKYGTFEFRYFPSTTSQADLVKWVKFVQLAKRCARAFEDDASVLVERLLQGNVAAFLQEYFDVDGIAAELLTSVNNADSIVVEKAGEIGAIMEMRPSNVDVYSNNLSSAARRYIERFNNGETIVTVVQTEPSYWGADITNGPIFRNTARSARNQTVAPEWTSFDEALFTDPTAQAPAPAPVIGTGYAQALAARIAEMERARTYENSGVITGMIVDEEGEF
jgi:hypothetical protein